MQAGHDRPGFDVTRGVVFNDDGYGNG